MKTIPLIRAATALSFARLVESSGPPPDDVWNEVGLPPRALLDREQLVPLRLVLSFIEEAATRYRIGDLGVRLARQAGLQAAGGFGAAIRRAPTLLKAIEVARDAVHVHNSGARYWMVPGREAVRVCRRFRDQGMAFRQFDLLTVAVMTQVVSLVADPGWYPSHIELQSSGPLGPVDRAVFGDAVISAGQPVTSIAIPRRYLARPLHLPHAAADDHDGGSAWLRSAPPADFLSSSRVLVEVLLRGARSEVADAAKAAGMSVRSFQRHLAESGTSYSALVDEARLATATRLLADRDVKIIEIALALGYSDPAHFTRAFRRWTAVSPVAYRRALLERELAA